MRKIILMPFVVLALQACAGDPAIQRIQGGTFNSCEEATIGELVDNFFASPSWSLIEADDGQTYVNLTGEMTLDEEPVNGLVQFTAPLTDEAAFEINAFELNEIPQNAIMVAGLVTAMCDEY